MILLQDLDLTFNMLSSFNRLRQKIEEDRCTTTYTVSGYFSTASIESRLLNIPRRGYSDTTPKQPMAGGKKRENQKKTKRRKKTRRGR